MFSRPEHNYDIADTVLDGIIQDCAQPLNQITNLIPEGSKILDIGAGSGTLSRVFTRLGKSVEIDGIEPNNFAAELARPYYQNLLIGYTQDHLNFIRTNTYDYVILADVIEHIEDPISFLSELLSCLPNSTKLILSMPNIAFGGVRLALMNGNFDYVDSGLIERTHLRFYTLQTAQKLFEFLGLHIHRCFSLDRSFYRVEFPREDIRASIVRILNLSIKSDARAYQYLFVLSKLPCEYCEKEQRGASALTIMLDALIYRPCIIRMVKCFLSR